MAGARRSAGARRWQQEICGGLREHDLGIGGVAIVPDPERIVTGGHGNKTARTIAVRRGEQINAKALTAMLRQIIANNRAGGWRKLKRAD